MLFERGITVCTSIIMRWDHQYAPILDSKIRKHLKKITNFCRGYGTYIKIGSVANNKNLKTYFEYIL